MTKEIMKIKINKVDEDDNVLETIELNYKEHPQEFLEFTERYMDSLWQKFNKADNYEDRTKIMAVTAAFLVHLGKECGLPQSKIENMIENVCSNNVTRTLQ